MSNQTEEEVCDQPIPETIYWVNPNVVGCRDCKYLNAYFECGHELEHDCEEWRQTNG
jgi:hypothetical protein